MYGSPSSANPCGGERVRDVVAEDVEVSPQELADEVHGLVDLREG